MHFILIYRYRIQDRIRQCWYLYIESGSIYLAIVVGRYRFAKMYLKTFYPINFQDVSWKAITFYKLAQWRAYLVFWHADVVIKEQSNVNSNLLWNFKKKKGLYTGLCFQLFLLCYRVVWGYNNNFPWLSKNRLKTWFERWNKTP